MFRSIVVLCLSFTINLLLKAQPVAGFTASPKQGCNPLKVDFTNTSTGAVSYYWKFGNGNTSTIPSPSAIYNNPGKYSVTLIATDAGGKSDTITYSNLITAFKNPQADFSQSIKEICAGDSIHFYDKTTRGDAGIKLYSWDLGDGGTEFQRQPVYKYLLSGTFTVTLAVEDSNGCRSFAKYPKLITVNGLPSASINNGAEVKCTVPFSINFSGTYSGTSTLTYQWKFGDGDSSSSANPSHTYSKAGVFNVRLVVTDGKGCKYAVNKPSLVTIQPPVAFFDTTKKEICPHQSVTFVNKSSPLDGTGHFVWKCSTGDTSVATNPTFRFDKPGSFQLNLTYYWDGCQDTFDQSAAVLVHDTASGFVWPADSSVCHNSALKVNYQSTGMNIDHVLWYSKAAGLQDLKGNVAFRHPTGTNGRYGISAVLYSPFGCRTPLDSVYLHVHGPQASVLTDSAKGCIPYKVNAIWSGSSDTGIRRFQWSASVSPVSSDSSSLHFTNQAFGNQMIQLVLEDSAGCMDTGSASLQAGVKVDLQLTAPLKVCRNQKFYIHRKASVNGPDSVKFFYYWDKKDSIPFPLPDSLKQIRNDTPGIQLLYGLIANSYGCVSKLDSAHRPLVRIMGPLPAAKVISDCVSDTVTGINQSLEFTRVWWKYKTSAGVDGMLSGPYLRRKIEDTKNLWLFAENDTNHCLDSMPYNTSIDIQQPSFNYVFDCDSQKFTTQNTYTGLADSQFHWVVTRLSNGNKTTLTGRNISMKLPGPGVYKVMVTPNNPKFTCSKPFSRNVTAYQRPKAAASVDMVSTACYPVDLKLNDPSWTFWKSGTWNVGRFLSTKDSASVISATYTDNLSNLGIYLIRYDSNSCIYRDTFTYTVGGVKATIDPKQVTDPCRNSVISVKAGLKSGTAGATYKYLWDWGFRQDTTATDTVVEHGVKTLPLYLYVYDNLGCASKDYLQFNVKTGRPVAKFSISDSTATCPPLNATFYDKSSPGNSPLVNWYWNFGDSSYSGKQNPGKIFISPGKFSIQLIITNAEGCKDTMLRKDMVKINGPVGNYKASTDHGCSPLPVKLSVTINGKIAKLEFDMGDGSVLGGSDSAYTFTRAGNYIPRLILIDSLGCKFSPPPDDTIAVYPLPLPDFDNFNVCDNQDYQIKERSYYGGDNKIPAKWWLNGVPAGAGDSVKIRFNTQRNNLVLLQTESVHGCKDSVAKPFVAYGMQPSLTPGKPKYCLGEKVKVQDHSTSDTTIVHRIVWINNQVLDPVTLTFPGNAVGILPAMMELRDTLGCRDTFNQLLFIKLGDTIPPPPLAIYRSSVLDDWSTETKFAASAEPDFDHYALYVWNSGTWNMADSSSNRADTNLIAKNLNTLVSSYCHQIRQVNFCYRSSDSVAVVAHCTVETKAVGDTNVARVSWTPYQGWQTVLKYRIWRKRSTDLNFSLIDSVAGDSLHYTDTAVYCHVVYDYRIEAVEQNGHFEVSYSDTARAKPIHKLAVPAPEVWRTTVDTNSYTHTEWLMTRRMKYPVQFYTFWKYDAGNWFVYKDSIAPAVQSLNDHNVQVGNFSYSYKVQATDVCDTKSQLGNAGTSVLLSCVASASDIYPGLTWTPYSLWHEGVYEYIVERRHETGPFVEIGRVDGNTLRYQDNSLPPHCARDFTYRVTAVRKQPVNYPDSSYRCISVSNYAMFVPVMRFYIPNAFTPNNNQLNDGFRPEGLYYFKYRMEIFNRYGQKIYDGDSCRNQWDGRFEEKECPDGVYGYLIHAWDLSGKEFVFSGTIHLFR